MKKVFFSVIAIISVTTFYSFSTGGEDTNSTGGAPAGTCGDPASGFATCKGCHISSFGPSFQTGWITSNVPPTGYIPGNTYTVTATITRPGHAKFGFQASPQNSAGTLLGTLSTISGGTQLVGTGKYVTHTNTGTSGSGTRTWNFGWTAPSSGTGLVTFYGAFNASNANGGSGGDSIFTSMLLIGENGNGIPSFDLNEFKMSVFPNPSSEYVKVRFYLEGNSDVAISLMDIHGNVVSNLFSETTLNGEVNKTFDVLSYPKGVYFLLLRVDGRSALQKIIKM